MLMNMKIQDYSELVINRKNDNDLKICRYDIILKALYRCSVSIVKFNYWS